MNGKELLIDGIEKIGLEISEEQANQLSLIHIYKDGICRI